MNKTKLIIHEKFSGKQSLEDVFLSAFQTESYQLIQDSSSSIMSVTEQSQYSFCSGKELKNVVCGGNVTHSCDAIRI